MALAPSALSPQTQDLEPAEDGLPPGQPGQCPRTKAAPVHTSAGALSPGPGVSHPSQPHPEVSGVLSLPEAVAWGQTSRQMGCEAHPRGRQRGQVGVKPRRLPCRSHGGSSRVAVATDGWVGGRPSAVCLAGTGSGRAKSRARVRSVLG